MPGLYKDEGVVLKTIKLGEADRIVTIYTRHHGKVRAVAKGVRKTKSRFGARLEPYTLVDLIVYRGRKELDTITGADIISSFKTLKTGYAGLTAAAALADLVEKITPERERAVSVYALLLAGLQSLEAGGGNTVVPAFLVKLLSLSGYHPALSVCAGCGDPGGLGAISAEMGGAVCRSCWTEDENAFRLAPERIALIERFLASDLGYPAPDQDAFEVTDALRRYTEYYLERPLRSLSLLAAS
ncbi:MAG: DNA repair protein RecO [Actinomycetota bacterium]|nr:DNA repair protein RecO [Actinomycetota bacterium]